MLLTIPGYSKYLIDPVCNKVVSVNSRGEMTELMSRIGDNGYLSVTMTSDTGERTPVELHRIVGKLLVMNDSPTLKDQINHVDRDKLNNRPGNLEWCTQGENVKHAYATGHSRSRHVYIQNLMSGVYTEFSSLRDAAKFFQISPMTMCERLQKSEKLWDGYWIGYLD